MKLKILCMFVTIVLVALPLAASDLTAQVLKQRRKAFKNCECYLQLAQKKSQLTVGVASVKVTYEGETQTVKPGDETIQLGMKMQSVCQAFLADPKMTTREYLEEMHKLEDKQRQIEKVIIGITESLHFDVRATAIKNEKKN